MNLLASEKIDAFRTRTRSVVRELGLLNDAYFDIGVTLAERHLLIELNSCHKPTMGEIALRLLIDKSTVSRLIAKAAKKGYISCSGDSKDGRRRKLELTEKGRATLDAFECIAIRQTKEALQILTEEEINTVYRGMALYAKGLKISREQNQVPHLPNSSGVFKLLSDQGYSLKPFCQEDEQDLYEIFHEVIESRSQFPYVCSSREEFYRQFLPPQSSVYVCRSETNELVGGFYLRSNYSGHSHHIANAAYMIKSSFRGKGLGKLLVKASMQRALDLGFQAMQFNMVLSQNRIAVSLYKKLGFEIIGTIPHAVCNPDGSYQDGYIMYSKLE